MTHPTMRFDNHHQAFPPYYPTIHRHFASPMVNHVHPVHRGGVVWNDPFGGGCLHAVNPPPHHTFPRSPYAPAYPPPHLCQYPQDAYERGLLEGRRAGQREGRRQSRHDSEQAYYDRVEAERERQIVEWRHARHGSRGGRVEFDLFPRDPGRGYRSNEVARSSSGRVTIKDKHARHRSDPDIRHSHSRSRSKSRDRSRTSSHIDQMSTIVSRDAMFG